MSEKFAFNTSAADKILNITVRGNFEKEDGLAYISEYKNVVKSINASEYTLKFDCTELSVSKADAAGILENCFKLYHESNFKKVIITISESQLILKMQFNRIAKNAGLNNLEIVVK